MDRNELMDKLNRHFVVSSHTHDNEELFAIIGKLLQNKYTYYNVRKELSKFQKRLGFYFSLFLAREYRPGITAHEAFRKDMSILKEKTLPPTLRELYAVCELMEQKIILLKKDDDSATVSGFYITPILRKTAKEQKIILLLTFVDGEPYFRHLEGDERNLIMCSVTIINENHDMCLDKRFKNSFRELNASFILKQVEELNKTTFEKAEATITASKTENTNISVFFSQLVYGSACMEDFVKDHVIAHMRSEEFHEIYQTFVCLDNFKEEQKAIDQLPEGKEKDTEISVLRRKAFDFHLKEWDAVDIVDFFAFASVFNVEIYAKKEEEYNLYLPICSSFFEMFITPIYIEHVSKKTLIPLTDGNNCLCIRERPFISSRMDRIEDYVMKRLVLEPCCVAGRHGTHTHFSSTVKDSQIVLNDQISSYQSSVDRHVEKVTAVLDSQGRKLDQINGGKGSLEQCLSREIFGDEDKISLLKSRLSLDKAMNREDVLIHVAKSTGKPLFVFKYYEDNYSWVLFEPPSTEERVCRYYITIFYNGQTGCFDRIVAKNGCNCNLPSPDVDVETRKKDLKRDIKKIPEASRHRPLLTFLTTDLSPALFKDEVRRVPAVFSRYSDIPFIVSRYDMQDKEIDFMFDYSYSLCRCISKEIFGTENKFECIMKEVMNEIQCNPDVYGKLMRWDFLKNFTSRKEEKLDLFTRKNAVEKQQAHFYASRIEDGMETEDLELFAIATCFQVPIFVMCVEEDEGIISTFWKEYTQLKRKRKPIHLKNIAREPYCIQDDGLSKYFIMVYRTFAGHFHRIVSKEVCNCLTEQPFVPGIEYHKVEDKHIFAKMRRRENRITVTRIALDNWVRCNIALELLCTRIIDGLEGRRKNVNIASIVGSSVSLIGGALALGGLLAAPLTAGSSLGLTIAGGVVGGMGGVTSVGSKISEAVLNKDAKSQMERYQMNLRERSRFLEKSIKAVDREIKNLLETKDYADSMDNISVELATSAMRSLTLVPVIVLRIIARAITWDMILDPLSILHEIEILRYSIHNLVEGSRTRETERLRTIRTVLKIARVQMQIWGYGNQKKLGKYIKIIKIEVDKNINKANLLEKETYYGQGGILRVFKNAYELQEWEKFNSMYSDLLLAKDRSVSVLRGEMQGTIRHFVKENIKQNVKKVYFGFCLKRTQTVLVVIIDNIFFDLERATTFFMGLPILYKQWSEVTEESVNTMKNEANEDSLGFREDVHVKIHDCLMQNSAILLKSHSNVEIICASPYRSIDKGKIIHKENCILIYCSVKNVIPLGEMFFEEKLGEFRIDVREGFFYRYPRKDKESLDTFAAPTDRHPELKIGSEISRKDGNVTGTLGGFVKFGDKGDIGFITCAHVLHDEPELMIENHAKVVQPSYGLLGTNDICGYLIKSVHPTGFDKVTVDASLVQVDSSRKPTRISLAGLRKDQIRKLGFSPNEIYSGEILENAIINARCYKSGATTGFTIGKLEGRSLSAKYLDDFRDQSQKSVVFRDQYVVSRTGILPFASSGDSGAFVFQCVEDSGKKSYACIGMIVGGTSDSKVVVTPIREVLNALDMRDTKKLCTFEDEEMETDEKSGCLVS